jgi:transmembrane serine protease 11D
MKRYAMVSAALLATLSAPASGAPTALEAFIAGDRQLSDQELRQVVRDLGNLSPAERRSYLVALRADPRIIGGRAVTIADHPWQVALVRGYMAGRYQFCGGSLIAPDVVVTAAHCIDNTLVQNDPQRVDIIAGTALYPEGGERIKARAIYVHPQWNASTNDFDVAIISLAQPSTLGRPVALTSDNVSVGTRAWVTGWGSIREGGDGTPDLLGAQLPVVDTETCNQPDSYGGAISAQMICAGLRDGGVDSCQGDSGGPLTAGTDLASARLIGIVSFGEGCGRRLKYGVYTRVSSVAQWIQSFLAR